MSVRWHIEQHDEVERLHMAHAIAGRPLKFVTVHRVGDVLVDSGCAWGRPALKVFLRERPVRAVLTTHEHEDHVGNHAMLARHHEPPVVHAPARAVRLLDDGPPRLPPYRWLTWGAHEAAPGARPLAGAHVDAGDRRFRALATPGHSNDHVAYLDETSSALFGGDAFLGRLKVVRAKEDVPLQMQSVRRMAELDAAVLYPAHGRPIERPRGKLLEVADHFNRLGEKARRLHEAGRTPRQIRQDLFGHEPALTYVSLGAFSAENLVRSLLGARVDI